MRVRPSAFALAFAFAAFDAIDSFASVFALAPAFVFFPFALVRLLFSRLALQEFRGCDGYGSRLFFHVRVPRRPRRYVNAAAPALLARRVFPRTNQSTSVRVVLGNAAHADAANAPRFESGFARASEE